VLDANAHHSIVQVELHEGRNRIVRRMFDAVGFPVEELVRTQFGPVRLGTLQPGELRELGKADVGALMAAAGL
jgi:23S rRNA pseudouridine2605 synthase